MYTYITYVYEHTCYILLRATSVGAYDDRAVGFSVRNPVVSTLCPVIICHYSWRKGC